MAVQVITIELPGAPGPVGPAGPTGPTGPANNITIGNVVYGDLASATLRGTSPNQILDLTIPKGDRGDIGPQGPQGPAGFDGEDGLTPLITVGTVTTGAPGSNAQVTLVGTAPNYTLNLTIPKGDTGAVPTLTASSITGLAAVATSGSKVDVGLGNVDNTSDANKPISNAQQTALSNRLIIPSVATTPAALTGTELFTVMQGANQVKLTLAEILTYSPTVDVPEVILPDIPSGLSVVATSASQVEVTWSPVGTYTFDIERNGEIIRTARAGTSFVNTVGVLPGTTYTYRVRAYDAERDLHSDWSEARSATTPSEVESAGELFQDSFDRATAPDLGPNWNQTSVKIAIVDGLYAAPATTTTTIATWNQPTRTGNQEASVVFSTLPGIASFIGPVVRGPLAPGTGSALTGSLYVGIVSGSASDAVSIRRKEDQSTTLTTLATASRQIVAGDTIKLTVEGASSPILKLYVNNVEVLSVQDTSTLAIDDTSKYTGIYATGSTAVRLDNFKAGDIGSSGDTAPVVSVPATPIGFTTSAISSNRIDLDWEPSVTATTYEYRMNGGTPISSAATSVAVVGLSPSTTYTFEVRAGNSAGWSAWSAPLSQNTLAATTLLPGVPTDLRGSVISSTEVTFGWTAPLDTDTTDPATSYDLDRNGTIYTGYTTTYVTNTGLSPSTTYVFKVRAKNVAGYSAWTAPFSLTTPATPASGGAVTDGSYMYAIGRTKNQIMALPTSGAAWTRVKAQADLVIDPALEDHSSDHSGRALAAALVFVRTGDTSYKTKVVNALEGVRSQTVFYYSAVYRLLAGYAFAADLVGHRTSSMLTFFDQIRDRTLPGNTRFGKSMRIASWDCANNHGTYARGSFAACSAYLRDTSSLADLARWQKFWLGDGTQPGISSHRGTTYWRDEGGVKYFTPNEGPLSLTRAHPTTGEWFGINPASSPSALEGIMPMDIYRDGATHPGSYGSSGVMYTFTAGVGALVTNIVLAANGYPEVWQTGDRAALRWRLKMHSTGNNYLHSHGSWMDHLLNKTYTSTERGGVTLPQTNTGRSNQYGFTDWLYP